LIERKSGSPEEGEGAVIGCSHDEEQNDRPDSTIAGNEPFCGVLVGLTTTSNANPQGEGQIDQGDSGYN
jgi:hypothetical protein